MGAWLCEMALGIGILIPSMLCLYLLSFPIAVRGHVSNIPRLYLPAARLLETPAREPFAWYLQIWNLEPIYVECATYQASGTGN